MKNVLIVSDWDFAYIWKKVIPILKEEESVNISVLVVGRVYLPFFNKLTLDKVYLLQDYLESFDDIESISNDEISQLERKYGDPNLWRCVLADRNWVKDDYNTSMKKISKCYSFFEKVICETKPDIVLTNAYASMPHHVMYKVAEYNKIPCVRPLAMRLDNYFTACYSRGEFLELPKSTSDESDEIVRQKMLSIKEKLPKPFYEKIHVENRSDYARHIRRLLNYTCKRHFSGEYKNDHTKPTIFKKIRDEATFYCRKFRQKNLGVSANLDSDFVFFPLHLQPEASTMQLAPYWLDQKFIIETIAKSLPTGVLLYVKEHPTMIGRRESRYYRELKSLPNVVVIKTNENTGNILKNALAVFTITGTVGIESLLMGKPTFILGNPYYRECSEVVRLNCSPIENWSEVIKENLVKKIDENNVHHYFSKIISNSEKMFFNEPLLSKELVLNELNINRIAKFFGKEVRCIK